MVATENTTKTEDAPVRKGQVIYSGESSFDESRCIKISRYMKRNISLPIGLAMIGFLFAISFIGPFFWDVDMAVPLAGPARLAPTAEHPFGTDAQGRDILAIIIAGTYLTVRTGILAGFLGVAIGGALGFFAAYYGGWVDNVINWTVDVLLTVPALLILVVIASGIQDEMSSLNMAGIIALLAWRRPTRQIRSQVLVMRSMGYVDTARISGMNSFEIIFKEMVPNLLPYMVASFVLAVSAAVLAAVGLQAMGLGPQNEPTLGMTVFWMMYDSAFLQGMWWWIAPPLVVLIILFVGLYLLSAGLDEFSNPRLRQKGAS